MVGEGKKAVDAVLLSPDCTTSIPQHNIRVYARKNWESYSICISNNPDGSETEFSGVQQCKFWPASISAGT